MTRSYLLACSLEFDKDVSNETGFHCRSKERKKAKEKAEAKKNGEKKQNKFWIMFWRNIPKAKQIDKFSLLLYEIS